MLTILSQYIASIIVVGKVSRGKVSRGKVSPKEGGGQKAKIFPTSFMDGPQVIYQSRDH